MRRRIATFAAAPLVALSLMACGGGDDDDETTTDAPEAPSVSDSAPSVGGLPPGIGECLAEEGYEIEPSELHSVPQPVLAKCFNALHQGGGP